MGITYTAPSNPPRDRYAAASRLVGANNRMISMKGGRSRSVRSVKSVKLHPVLRARFSLSPSDAGAGLGGLGDPEGNNAGPLTLLTTLIVMPCGRCSPRPRLSDMNPGVVPRPRRSTREGISPQGLCVRALVHNSRFAQACCASSRPITLSDICVRRRA